MVACKSFGSIRFSNLPVWAAQIFRIDKMNGKTIFIEKDGTIAKGVFVIKVFRPLTAVFYKALLPQNEAGY